MPISFLILPLLLIISSLFFYYKVQVFINLQSEKSDQVLFIEIIPSLNRFKKQYRYTGYELVDIMQRSLVLQANPALRFFAFSLFPNRKINYLLDYPEYKLMAHFTVIEKVEWKTRIGINDAMYTAIITGIFWSLKGTVISLASRKSRLQKLTIDVQPDFSRTAITSRLICILKMRIVHIIIIVIYSFGLKVRRYINGYGTGKATTKSSH